MKLIKITKLSPKRLFGSKKTRSDVSWSNPSSFGSGTMSTSSSSDGSVSASKPNSSCVAEWPTPKSVLPPTLSGEWSDMSTDLNIEPAALHKVVSKKELAALLSRLGEEPPSQAETELMFREVGMGFSDEEEHVNVDELLGCVGSGCEVQELREAFDFFDADHDGRITAEELLTALAAMGDKRCTLEDCRRMIAEVDKNRDGFVCFEDFTRMMELQI